MAQQRNTISMFSTVKVRIIRAEATDHFDCFMQNKANLRKAQINVKYYLQKDYGNESAFRVWKNKANQTQFPRGSK